MGSEWMTKAVGLPQTSTRPKKRAKNRRYELRKERNEMLRIKYSVSSPKNTEHKAKEVQMKLNTYVVVRNIILTCMMKQILQELSYT